MEFDKQEIEKAFGDFARDIEKFTRINIGRKRKRRGRFGRYTAPIDNTGSLRKGFKIRDKINSGLSAELELELDHKVKDYFFVVNDGRRKGKMPPLNPILEWVKSKPVRARGADGAFVKNSEAMQRQLAYQIARKIKEDGTEPTYFFTEGVEQAFDKHESNLLESYFSTADNAIDFMLRQAFSNLSL